MIPVATSCHAAARLRQRGISDDVAAAAIEFADREVEIGNGTIALSLTKAAYRRMCRERGVQLAERAKHLLVILGDNTLVTVMHNTGRAGRRYVNSQY